MFKGLYTAIVTPFKKDMSIDEDALRRFIDLQIDSGVDGLVPCGSTGESPTLSYEEHEKVIDITCDQVNGRCHIIAGTGSNSTDEAIQLTKASQKAGVTASLQIVPYYNKPTQEGIYRHFKKIAEAVDIPIILYNIKGRTGINMETSTVVRLAEIDNIIGVKEASGSMNQILDVIQKTPDDFLVLSGDDKLTLPLIASGGHGVISVSSNVIPKEMKEYVDAGLNNDFNLMRKLHKKIMPFMISMSLETNPIPVKKALMLKHGFEAFYRLPLTDPTEETVKALKNVMSESGLI